MREWIFGNIIVKEVEFDYDLHNLEVYNGEKYLVVANFGNDGQSIRLDVARFGITELNAVFFDTADIRMNHKSDAGMFFVDAPPISVTVYKCN